VNTLAIFTHKFVLDTADMGRMLNQNVFPSLQRRGGRAIKKMMPKATKVGADGVVSSKHLI